MIEPNGEVDALGKTLDILKTEAENSIVTYKHSMNKKHHTETVTPDSFDPDVSNHIFR